MAHATTARTRRPGARGYVFLDALFAMSLLFTLVMVLGYTVQQHRQALDRFADRRTLVREAEHILAQMQAFPQQRITVDGYAYDLELVDEAGPRAWVRVTVEDRRGERASLLGQVPGDSAELARHQREDPS
ncbi:MAG: hypothetical protein WD009_13435 [Phycisphaeraceae bacterium]